jgi:hypothetical protein
VLTSCDPMTPLTLRDHLTFLLTSGVSPASRVRVQDRPGEYRGLTGEDVKTIYLDDETTCVDVG